MIFNTTEVYDGKFTKLDKMVMLFLSSLRQFTVNLSTQYSFGKYCMLMFVEVHSTRGLAV